MKTKPTGFGWALTLICFLGFDGLPDSALGQTPIQCGQTITNTTTLTNQTDVYTFSGTAGQILSVALSGPVSCPNDYMVADIYNGNGQLVASLSSLCNAGNALNLMVTNNGTHTIQVYESFLRATGSYSLSIQSVLGGGCNTKAIACGETITNSTVFNSQMDAYSYAGTAGQILSVAIFGPISCTGAGDQMQADVYNPTGELVARLIPDCNTGGALNLALTNTGIHTILVHEHFYRYSSSYSLSIQSVLGGGCNPKAMACGETITGSTVFNSQMDAYSYAGTAGQILSVAIFGPISCTGAGDQMQADVYNPNGELVASLIPDCNTGGALNLALTNNGIHTILVHEHFYRYSSSYSLSIQSVLGGGCNPKAIACGETIAGSTVFNSQMDAYAYAGTAGQILSVAIFGPISCSGAGDQMQADVYNPNGELVASLIPDCNTGGALNLALTNNGIHTILVHEHYYRYSSSYSLSIQSVIGGGCNARTITCGQTVTASTGFKSQMDAYSYAGNAGQMLTISLTGPIGCPYDYMVADVYNPAGQLVSSVASLCNTANALTFTLTNTGIHRILVRESFYRQTANYQLTLTVDGGCANVHLGSAIVRTQEVACLPLTILPASPIVWLSFAVQVPSGALSNLTLNVPAAFTNATVTPTGGSQWLVTLQTGPSNGVMGNQIGTLCLKAIATQSVFAPVLISNVVITNQGGSLPAVVASAGRVLVIADQSLLEAHLSAGGQRLVTLYGKPNTDYLISGSTNLGGGTWLPGWTNHVPSNLQITTGVQAPFSNAPVLFLRAVER